MSFLIKRDLFHSPITAGGVFLVCALVARAGAQGAPSPPTGNIGIRMAEVNVDYGFQRNLLLTVFSAKKTRLSRQAVVKLHDRKRDITTWLATTAESEVVFHDLDFGDYDVEISAVGYLTEHKELKVTGTLDSLKMEIILQPDPGAVELSAADDAIPAKQRKDANKVVHDLESANYKDAQKRLEKLYQQVSSSAQINFLYGYLFVQTHDTDKAEEYLGRAVKLDPRRVQALTLLGRVQLERQHYGDAQKTLEQAIEAKSDYWLAHSLLADAYLKSKDYEKARAQAEVAIGQGKAAASSAQLVLGQALVNQGKDAEGLQILNAYVQSNPTNPVVPQVKDIIAKVERRDAAAANGTIDIALAAGPPSLAMSAWGPPGVDDVTPAVAMGVSCPFDQVMKASGERTAQLVQDLTRFAAIENIVHEQLDKTGNPVTKEVRKFDYVASISEERPGYLETEEFRSEKYGIENLPDGIVTKGFVTLALIFHPAMRDNFEMNCEGLGDWHGQATWLVHFRQRDDKPSRFADYVAGSERYPMRLKGRAWIRANDFQIVRIESDLASRVPQLTVQHQIAEYGPVHFQQRDVELWLPQSVDIYMELNRHRYYRRHSFDHYMLFSVASEDKTAAPKNGPPPGGPVQNR